MSCLHGTSQATVAMRHTVTDLLLGHLGARFGGPLPFKPVD